MTPRIAQPHWVQFNRRPYLLHRLAQGAIAVDKWACRSYRGVTLCGRTSDQLWYPGVFSRLGATRCKRCCKAVGIPPGDGTAINAGLKENRAK